VAVPNKYAIPGIFLGYVDNLISLHLNFLIDFLIILAPLLGLRRTGEDKNQFNLWDLVA